MTIYRFESKFYIKRQLKTGTYVYFFSVGEWVGLKESAKTFFSKDDALEISNKLKTIYYENIISYG